LFVDDGNVQIRLFSGEAVTQKFSVREPLAAIRLFVHGKIAGGHIDGDIGTITFTTSFPPRRVFTEDEMMMPLCELGSTLQLLFLLFLQQQEQQYNLDGTVTCQSH